METLATLQGKDLNEERSGKEKRRIKEERGREEVGGTAELICTHADTGSGLSGRAFTYQDISR